MHFLDLIIYIVLAIIIWYVILPRDYTEEIGALLGIRFMIWYTIAYVIIFVFCGINWIDFPWSISFQNFFKW